VDFLLPLKWFTVRRLLRVFAPQLRSGENLLVAAAAEAYLGGEGQRRNGVVAVTDERVLVLQVNRLIPLAAGEVIFVSPRQETLVMPSRGGARRSIGLENPEGLEIRLDFPPLWWHQWTQILEALVQL